MSDDEFVQSGLVAAIKTASNLEKRIAELERENAALRAEVKITRQNYEEYKRENIALRADKERLEWLDEHCEVIVLTNCDGSDLFIHNAFLNPDKAGKLRSIIDAARKEAQP